VTIEADGYFPYDVVFSGTDHRCLWVDITYKTAFGHNMAPLHKKQARRLHCKDPCLIDNYNSLFCRFALSHNLFDRVTQLDRRRPASRGQSIKEYEEIEILHCKAAAFAEKNCRKLRKGNVAFSLELNMIRLTIRAWSLVLNKAKGMQFSSRMLSRALKKAKMKP